MKKPLFSLPSGAQLCILEQCGSTSVEAKQRLNQGKCPPFWVLTREQHAGYGRRGRHWQMHKGDFAGSLVYSPHADPASFGEFSFITALAVFGALESLCTNTPLSPDMIKLKWPNDVLLGGEKVCGILLEMLHHPAPASLCIGIGINVVAKPQDTPYPATCLGDHGLSPDIETLVGALDDHFHLWVDLWQQRGFAPVRDAWCTHAYGIGGAITVNLPDQSISGIFEEIDINGHLLLKTDAGIQKIAAGDVFFP